MTELAVIFDLDGTLVDSAPDIHVTANTALAAIGLPQLDFATVRGFIGKGVPNLLAELLIAVDEDPTGPNLGPLSAVFNEAYEHAVANTVLFPHVSEALAALATAGHKMAICTNKPERPARTVLDNFGLTDYFDNIVGGDTLTVRKPDARPVIETMTLMNVTRALFVGDSETDALSAANTGLPFALFTEGYRKSSIEQIASFAAFGDYRELNDIVARAARIGA